MSETLPPRLAQSGGARDPFTDISRSVQGACSEIARAIEGIVTPSTTMRITNILIDKGKVNVQAISIEVRPKA